MIAARDTVILEIDRAAAIATLTLSRPEKLNALNAQLLFDLSEFVRELVSDGKIRAAVLTGAGEKAFAAGADIAEMQSLTTAEAYRFAQIGHAIGNAIENAPFPIIAAVNGFALGGGCELALACDFIYASDKAKFGQPEVNLGVIPGFGGTQRLARRVGISRARELCYTGDMIGAEEALRIGLANAVVPAAELLNKAHETAKKIASKGPLAIAQAKRVLFRGADVPLQIACELEVQAFASLFDSADQKEGMTAFLGKRAAAFSGK
ncbi:MAG: enoyl-CoA hydratase-related protein [Polyangiaceae bacterium]